MGEERIVIMTVAGNQGPAAPGTRTLTSRPIPPHVLTADFGESLVLMDSKRGGYFVLQGAMSQVWRELQQPGRGPAGSGADRDKVLRHLVAQGLLEDPATAPTASHDDAAVTAWWLSVGMRGLLVGRSTRIRWLSRARDRLLPPYALALAVLAVRRLSVWEIVGQLSRSKDRSSKRRRVDQSRDGREPKALREVVEQICDSRIRHLVPSGCLELSLAMTFLCLAQGWPVKWCVGARIPPFEAHAWVEVPGMPAEDPKVAEGGFRELVSLRV
jgi:hypothetical protein